MICFKIGIKKTLNQKCHLRMSKHIEKIKPHKKYIWYFF